MSRSVYQEIRNSLHELYLSDTRPWLVGYSGSKTIADCHSELVEESQPFPSAKASNGECPIQIDTSTRVAATPGSNAKPRLASTSLTGRHAGQRT